MIFFGGFTNNIRDSTDKVVEYKELKWTLLGKLSAPQNEVSSIVMENKIYLLRSGWDTTPYIEVWENTGDLSDPKYQGTIMNNPDDFQFQYFSGEIIRIKSDQCK